MELWFWIWLVLAVGFSVGEMFTAGFFLLPFGIGAAAAAALAYFGVALGWQWTVFVGLSSLLLLTLRRFADQMTHDAPMGVAADRLIGRHGIALEVIDSSTGSGRVRVDREEWRADAANNVPIAQGDPIIVVSVVGAHLVVKPVPPGAAD